MHADAGSDHSEGLHRDYLHAHGDSGGVSRDGSGWWHCPALRGGSLAMGAVRGLTVRSAPDSRTEDRTVAGLLPEAAAGLPQRILFPSKNIG